MLGAVHQFYIQSNTTASVTAEGRPFTTSTLVQVSGQLANSPEDARGGSGSEETTAGKKAQVDLLVARVPGDTVVAANDKVIVTDVPGMNGTYEIQRRWKTQRHYRLFIREMKT
jgi:hypothetical protein